MRIYSYKTLKVFWLKYPDSRPALEYWYDLIESTSFNNPNNVIETFGKADIIGNGRIVFNISNNKYRLVAKFVYEFSTVYIRFIGTHKEYDKIIDISKI